MDIIITFQEKSLTSSPLLPIIYMQEILQNYLKEVVHMHKYKLPLQLCVNGRIDEGNLVKWSENNSIQPKGRHLIDEMLSLGLIRETKNGLGNNVFIITQEGIRLRRS